MANGWAFDKHVSAGHILTTVAMLVAGFFYITDLDKKYDVKTQLLQSELEHVVELQEQQNENVEDALEEQKQDIKDIKKLLEDILRKQNEDSG